MDEKPTPATRRAILGGTAFGLYAATAGGGTGVAATDVGNGLEPMLRVVADRAGLAAHRGTGLGTRVQLAEPLRRGTFVTRPREQHQGLIIADPYQAFCVVSVVDPAVVWVRDYTGPASLDWSGAKGDGVADDEPFINAMLANAHASWFQVEDGRRHRLGRSLNIVRALKLTGAGVRSSVFVIDTPVDAIAVSMPSSSDQGLLIGDIGIVGGMAKGAATAGSGIALDMVYLAKLSNIRIANCWNGIRFTRCGLTNLDTIRIDEVVNAGLLFDGGYNLDMRVTGFTVTGGKYGIRLQDMCDELLFADGVLSMARWALYADARAHIVNQRPEFCRFARVSFDSCANGIDLAQCVDFVFDACFVSCRPGNGAELGVRGPVENIQFVASTFFNNAGAAAVVGAGARETDFMACKFISNVTDQKTGSDTLLFRSGCGAFAVTQSRFRQGWDVVGAPRWQIRIESGGADDYDLSGNRFGPGGAGALLDERQGARRIIANNQGA